MKTEDLKVGSIIQYRDGQMNWVESKITRTTKLSVFFNGMGYTSIRRRTFDNHPNLYKIISI
jgi:hypothetical protein